MYNIKKKTIAGLLAVLLFAFSPACSIPADCTPVIYANAYNDRKQACNTVISCQKDETLLLILPSDTNFSSLKLWCKPAGKVSINGQSIKNGEICPIITADGTYELTCGEKSYCLTIISSRNVPTIFIKTETGSLDAIHADKAYKETGRMMVYENGELTVSTELDYIKGRGNQTWKGEKRPYNIKFPEKISFLGMEASRKWCLLANAPDDTLIRNSVALTLAQRMEIPYVCDCRAADLYINGDYRGSYLVTEKVEVSNTVVDIIDLDDLNEAANPGVKIDELAKLTFGGHMDCGNKRWTDIPVSPTNISGGYLIEFDDSYYDNESNGFITQRGQCVTVKSPSCASKDEIDYIYDYCCAAEDALAAEDGCNSADRHYSDYYDVSSLAKVFILNEYLLNGDVSFSSNFFSKNMNGKLVAGPVWDFDSCLNNGNTDGARHDNKLEDWCTNLLCNNRFATVFALAFRQKEFRDEAKRQWEKYRNVITGDAMEKLVLSLAENVKYSAVSDHFRWAPLVVTSPEKWADIYVGYCEALCQLAKERASYVEKGLSDNVAMLYYDFNGMEGLMFSRRIAVEGESLTVKKVEEANGVASIPMDGYTFVEWNTLSDGSGTAYVPGDEIVLNAFSTVLYAQWSTAK